MPEHATPIIANIAVGFVLAFVFGLAAHRIRLSPLVGYLVAGIVVGPFTPGFVADQSTSNELAELGVILLMFAVGLHFSLKDLLEVRAIALPGALTQIVAATAMGMAFARYHGWDLGGGIVFGLALSVASTVVMVRALQELRIIESERGRIAVGWLVVEDLAMVVALVVLPSLAGGEGQAASTWALLAKVALTLTKVGAFVAVMLIAGRRVIPWIMHYAAHTGSRELFRLAVYAVAIGVAFGAAKLFDVSFALGAFFAGMVLGESKLSQRATEEALPLRDAFAVLFFVSVGMLFDPRVLIEEPGAVLATLAIIVLGKSLAAFAIVLLFGQKLASAVTIAASLAQIGEFSFILIGIGVELGLVPAEASNLILAGAILSIAINSLVFPLVERALAGLPARPHHPLIVPAPAAARPDPIATVQPAQAPAGHEVIVGYGRVGSFVGARLRQAGRRVLVFEEGDENVEAALRDGADVVRGNAADPAVLEAADLAQAHRLYVTIPEPFEAGQVVEQARAINPRLEILARAHSDAAMQHLARLGASRTIMGEREIALRMLEGSASGPTPVG